MLNGFVSNEVAYLSGWGFSESLWQGIISKGEGKGERFTITDFHHLGKERILDMLAQALVHIKVIYAWSFSAIVIMELIRTQRLTASRIYFYAPAFKLNLTEKEKLAFYQAFDKTPQKLTRHFFTLVADGDREKINWLRANTTLGNKTQKESHLFALKWMFDFSVIQDELAILLASGKVKIYLAERDHIIDNTFLLNGVTLPNIIMMNGHNHLSLLGERYV
ncbi:hypothetical protein [Fangia hongkongensis]|uniref:hypothetical protein n=1 Tax=Fangia hongkongensis TaxID=270495 RepID=UPI00036C3840|nr:hypothetical protein [Fangia hongkongensis]MBK2124087.1 hypothetical protein [Fangia hongkongensis]